jgi:hypothetical protein
MNTKSHPFSIAALVVGIFVLVLTEGNLGMAATDAQANGSSTNANRIDVPPSVFVIPTTVTQGRDPFFPLSTRIAAKAQQKNTDPVKPVIVTLTLKGISRTDTQMFALINDKTFATGEERDVQVGTGKVRVHCIEIREDSVTVEANGSRQELKLRPGL